MLCLALVGAAVPASAKWVPVYATGADGAPASGDVSDLRDAVREGLPIRVYWTAGPVEHSADATFTTVFQGHVLAQIEPILAQTVNAERKMKFADGTTRWRALFSTDGTMTSVRTGQAPKTEPMTIRWFVDRPEE